MRKVKNLFSICWAVTTKSLLSSLLKACFTKNRTLLLLHWLLKSFWKGKSLFPPLYPPSLWFKPDSNSWCIHRRDDIYELQKFKSAMTSPCFIICLSLGKDVDTLRECWKILLPDFYRTSNFPFNKILFYIKIFLTDTFNTFLNFLSKWSMIHHPQPEFRSNAFSTSYLYKGEIHLSLFFLWKVETKDKFSRHHLFDVCAF